MQTSTALCIRLWYNKNIEKTEESVQILPLFIGLNAGTPMGVGGKTHVWLF